MLVFIASERAWQTPRPWVRWAWQKAALVCTVVAAASNEMTLLHLLLVISLLLGVSCYRRQWPQVRWWTSLLLLALLVAVVVVIAPGNFVRMQFEGYSKDPSRHNLVRQVLAAIPATPGAMWQLLTGHDFARKLLLPLLLWVPTAWHWQRRGWLGSTIRLPWYWAAAFVVAGLASSAFLFKGIMGQIPPDRVINGLLLFMFPALVLVVWAALAYHSPRLSWQLPVQLQRWGLVLYLGVFSCLGLPYRAWQELLLSAPAYDEQLLAREEQMRSAWSQGIENLVVMPIIGVKPYRVLIVDWDLTTNPWHYVNTETALYFDVKTIVVDKQLVSEADPGFHYVQE
jgi:hypothetical protein